MILASVFLSGVSPPLSAGESVATDKTEWVRVACSCGSITAVPGQRVKCLEGLQQRFPRVNWKDVHAAIGGTGSDLGVFRLQQDALGYEPDLLFVEFSVNDGDTAPGRIHRAMEGIVCQTCVANLEAGISFVDSIIESVLADLMASKCSRTFRAMEDLANHNAISPSRFGAEVRKQLDAGTLVFRGQAPGKDANRDAVAPTSFSHDGVHRLIQTGHVLYAGTVARGLNEMENERPATVAAPHQLGKTMRAVMFRSWMGISSITCGNMRHTSGMCRSPACLAAASRVWARKSTIRP